MGERINPPLIYRIRTLDRDGRVMLSNSDINVSGLFNLTPAFGRHSNAISTVTIDESNATTTVTLSTHMTAVLASSSASPTC